MADAALRIETACQSDPGGRDDQQDRVAVLERDGSVLAVLADGMGGHAGGALAAQAVVDTAEEALGRWSGEDAPRLLASIVDKAHERIRRIGLELGISPHSTCVLLHASCGFASWIHVGDSRLYRFVDGKMVERTIDHSVVELMRLQGRISEDDMKTHPDQNRLYETLGGARAPEPERGSARVEEGSGFLLGSDGVWENAADRDLERLFDAGDLPSGVRWLVGKATTKGGASCDNLAVAAVRFRGGVSRGGPEGSRSLAAQPLGAFRSAVAGRESDA